MAKIPLSALFRSKKGEEDTSIGPIELIDLIRFVILIVIITAIWVFIKKQLK